MQHHQAREREGAAGSEKVHSSRKGPVRAERAHKSGNTPHGGVDVSKQLWADVWLMATRTLHVLEGLWSV